MASAFWPLPPDDPRISFRHATVAGGRPRREGPEGPSPTTDFEPLEGRPAH